MNSNANFLNLLLFIFIGSGCSRTSQQTNFNSILSTELDSMAFKDQEVQQLFINAVDTQRTYKDSLQIEKEKIFEENCEKATKILSNYGYPGKSMVGEKSSKNFWLIVQHCDNDLNFQHKVLEEMKKQVDLDNADGRNYAYLLDRVKINSGGKQVYGTQVQYDTQKGIAIPMELEDLDNVDELRNEVGLGPLGEYIEMMTNNHREMNREIYEQAGILKPK